MATLCWPSILIVLAFFVVVTDAEMHCLVARPRFGLVSQQCPIHTIGCRIRIERNSVSFYEFLDRNQFVCVMKGEFGDQHGSGCLRKRSGTIRCWCFGRSDCNTPENSKLLLEAFLSGDERKFHEAIQQVDFADLAEEEGEEGEFGQQQITTQLVPMNNGSEKTNYPSFDIATTETTTTTTKLKNIVTPNTTTIRPSTTKTTRTFHRHNKQHHHNHQHNATAPTPSYSSITRRGSTNSTPATVGMLQSEYDRQNKVHIIHVSTRDRYEPVNIFGSEAMKRIMAQESRRLKAEIADVSAEEYSDEDDEEYDEADKEAEEERAVARREMPKQKPKMAKHRMEQRERGASGSSEEQTEELKSVLGDEYFDSSFVAPASACICRATALGTFMLILAIHFWPLF